MKITDLFAKTDSSLEKSGVWHDIPSDVPGEPPLRLLVARINNPNAVKLYRELHKPYARLEKSKGYLPESIANEIMAELLSRTVLLDWENLEDANGAVPYSQQAAKRLLLDNRGFRDAVSDLANQESAYVADQQEAIDGN